MEPQSFNRVIVNLTALEDNFTIVQTLAGPDVPVMAMVKADGYGHGMVEAARAFSRAGCSCFGVAELREGVALREANVEGEIYVTLGFSKKEVGYFFSHTLIPVIYDLSSARALEKEAKHRGCNIGVHIKIDTGMSRLGILPQEIDRFLAEIKGLESLRVTGLMSHFPESDIPASPSTERAISTFSGIASLSPSAGHLCHIANSGAVLNFPGARFDMVRAGIALYGYDPAGKPAAGPHARMLRPAMSFISRIMQVKELPAGTGISYGHTFVTTRKTTVAVIPVGYEDGFSRHLSNRGTVLVGDRRASVLGRVCMNMSMIDVTDIPGVKVGDEVTLMGKKGSLEVDADDLATLIGSISYEVLCALGNNNQREYSR